MKAVALIAAAGTGERLGAEGPKALVEVGGRTLLAWALDVLDGVGQIDEVVVAAPKGHEEDFARVAAGRSAGVRVVRGGGTRQASVAAALEAIAGEPDAVVCHDAARPFAAPALFAAVLDTLGVADGAVPLLAVADSVKRTAGEVLAETLDRADLGLAQTPQAFRHEALVTAHRTAARDDAADDAELVARAGFKVVAVRGDPANFKVTTPADLRLAEAVARGRG